METPKIRVLLGIILCAVFLLTSSPSHATGNSPPANPITLALHESAESFQARYPKQVRAVRQPAGISYLKAHWPVHAKGTARIQVGKQNLYADNLLSLTAVQDERVKAEGISTVMLVSGITGPHGITHEAARDYVFSVLSRLRKGGWKTSIPFDDPRLRGRDMLNYKMATGGATPLDADYKPTLEEWTKLPDLSAWELYSENAFLRISFKRSPNPEDPGGAGVYLVNFNLDSSVNHFKGFVAPLQRDEWRTLLPAELKDLASRRSAAEADLRNRGIPIDTKYKDPPIPP